MRSVSFLWVPASLVLVLAGSWFALMELLLHRPGFDVRAPTAALIVSYAIFCLRYSRSPDPSLRPALLLCAIAVLALGVYALQSTLRSSPLDACLLLAALGLIAQSLLTLTQTLSRPRLYPRRPPEPSTTAAPLP